MSTSRRHFLRGGLAAIGWGVFGRSLAGTPAGIQSRPHPTPPPEVPSDPLRKLLDTPVSEIVDGFPFQSWFTGDDWENDSIPFHGPFPAELPEPEQEVDVAIVGGGISGLATAWLLREHHPVLFDVRARFGGNAQGEEWRGTPFSLGGAYVITPDEGSFLEQFYVALGLDTVYRESFPPDPIEVGGVIHDDFWSGAGLPAEQQLAFRRYAEVVTSIADDAYPEIPLPDDPAAAAWVLELDRRTFREDVEQRMGVAMPPLLRAAVQGYFYSSFAAGMDEISAAAGWNFVAAEEYGRWVFPGGNSYMARAMWRDLREIELRSSSQHGQILRPRCAVFDVRPAAGGMRVTWQGPDGRVRALLARHVVMAGSKHIAKRVLFDLEHWDPGKWAALNSIETVAYLVANVLLDAPVQREFYDAFLVGDETFPMEPGALEVQRPVMDMLRGDYTVPSSRSVLTLYWPLPWPSSRFTLLLGNPWQDYAERLAPQLRRMLGLIDIDSAAVRQVRLTRWGHAMPIARPLFIADGTAERVRRPLDGRVHFVNQDNWALPAVENSLLDAREAAEAIEADLAVR